MADVKNVLSSCAAVGANTGTGNCFTDFGAPAGVIFVPKGMTFTTASVSALQTALKDALTVDDITQRIFPVNNIINITDNSEKPVIQTSNLGAKKVIRDGYVDLTLEWWDGGFCLLYALRKANGMNRPFLIYTINGFLIGTDAGPGLMKGIIPALNWANAMGWSDGSKSSTYGINLNWNPAQTNENIAFVDFSSVGGQGYLDGLTGLENILISKISRVTATLTVALTTGCGGVNLYNTYPTQFIASLWRAYADNGGAPGNSINITSVTPDANSKGYAILVDTTDPDYIAGAPIWVSLAGPTELLAANIGGVDGTSGYESNTVSIPI